MNILGIFLINQIRTGGDRRYLELMESLALRGNKVYILMNTYLDYTPKYFTKIQIPIKYIRHRPPPASFLFKRAVIKYFNEIMSAAGGSSSIDFIHIHGDTYLKTAILLKKRTSKPLFYASRNNDIDRAHIVRSSGQLPVGKYLFSLLNELVERFREKQIAKYADIVTFQYPSDKDSFIRRTNASPSKIVIIPGNIGLPRCTQNWENTNKSETVKRILCVSATSITKGFSVILQVLKCLKQRGFESLRCTILGRITDQKLLTLIESANVSDMISLEGFVDPFPFLSGHDLLLYPVLFDAYPDAVLEALHTGCPVLASAVGGLPDMLKYPELLFESKNVEQIADRIEKCIVDQSFYKYIRKLCSERVEIHRFNWEERFEQAMSEYRLEKNNVS